jgi:hypothetical protein
VLVDVDGELLAEGQLHDGLVLAAPEQGESAPQHGKGKIEQCPDHRLILVPAAVEWEPESRAVVGLSSMDEEKRDLRKT